SGDSAGVEILAERSVRGRIVVRALGRKLRVRHQRRAALAGNGVADGEGVLPARGKLAAVGAEGGWQLWRVAVELRQAREQGAGKQHGVADRLGLDRIAGRGGSERSCDSEGGFLFDGPAKCRRLLERE